VSEQLALLPAYLTGHLQLALVALGLGTAFSVPAGIWVTRRPRLEPGVLGVASVVQTIPSLALLAIMVPILGGLGVLTARWLGVELRAIGYPPALVALTLYSVLPILRNTVAGIAGVDPALVEAARGVGMTSRQRLWRVELPLALPVIVAGVRTSAVWVVGTATLSTPVGATSLGNYIFSGLQTRNTDAVLVGCVAAAALALLLDQVIRMLEVGVRTRRRGFLAVALGVLVLLFGATGASFVAERVGEGARPVRIGAKSFTEQYILAEMLALRVREATDRPAAVIGSLGSTVAFDALRTGDLDAYVDYTGTIWATIMGRDATGVGREEVLARVRRFLEREHGIRVVARLGFENAYALAMRRDRARALGARSIGDLAPRAPALEIGGDYEFFQRPEWKELAGTYELRFRERRSMDPALMYQAVAEGEVDVIGAFTTDGRVAAYDLVLLDDPRGAIPPYDAVVLVSPEAPPEVAEALAPLEGILDEATMQRLNRAVDAEGLAPAAVARRYLQERDLAGRNR